MFCHHLKNVLQHSKFTFGRTNFVLLASILELTNPLSDLKARPLPVFLPSVLYDILHIHNLLKNSSIVKK